MKKVEIYKELIKKYPFVYFLRGEYYLIGYKVFKKCDNEEVDYYNIFCKEYNSLNLDETSVIKKYDIKIDEFKKLADAMRHIINITEQHPVECSQRDLKDMLETLSKTELDDLENQVLRYIKAYYYMSRYEIFASLNEVKQL